MRVIVLAVLIIFLIHLNRSYDFQRLPEEVSKLQGEVEPGAFLVLAEIDDETVIGVGTLVEIVVDTQDGPRRTFSQVAAMPGQKITLRGAPDGGLEVFVDGKSTWHTAPGSTPIKAGLIPEGYYLLLDPAEAGDGPDSRRLGLVSRKMLRRKILYAL